MQQESLIKALDIIVDSITKSNINVVDKTELLINLRNFLDPKEYEDSLRTLQEHQYTKKLNNRKSTQN